MVANAELQRVDTQGWRSGLSNLLHKENHSYWSSRRWLVQSLLWTILLNGFVAFALFLVPIMAEMRNAASDQIVDSIANGVQAFFQIGSIALAAGAIIMAQDTIIGERQLGVAEWILSKPVSRSAYILSKWIAYSVRTLGVLVLLQGIVCYGLLSLAQGQAFPLQPYLVGMLGLAIHTLFYLTLTLMLGVLTENRGTLLGISMGSLLGGLVAAGLLGKLAMLTPWSLVASLPAYVLAEPLPLSIWAPIGGTATLIVLCMIITLRRFEQLEF